MTKERAMDRCCALADHVFKGLSTRQRGLLASYLLNGERGAVILRRIIREDIARFAEMGADNYVSDLTEVLKCFDATFERAISVG
jgi:hypothetical protein